MNYPILLDDNEKYLAILQNAYDIIIEDEMLSEDGGFETLSFKISGDDSKRQLIRNERLVEVQGRIYVIRVIDDSKSSTNVCSVQCDALWYELANGELKGGGWQNLNEITPKEAIDYQLEGTGWTCESDSDERILILYPYAETVLYNLRVIARTYRGLMWFDTKNKKVVFKKDLGTIHQKIFCYERNVSSIKRVVDTRDMYSRFMLISNKQKKDGTTERIDISEINDGKPYVENYDWYDNRGMPRKVRFYQKEDNRFSVKENMLNYMTDWLAQHSKPLISYEISVSLLGIIPAVGDRMFAKDNDLSIKHWLTVIATKRNILQPELSVITFQNSQKSVIENIVSNTLNIEELRNEITTLKETKSGSVGLQIPSSLVEVKSVTVSTYTPTIDSDLTIKEVTP